ncbi:hypothetical protein QCM77_03565 [Bradyrhizobium sp. SSUT18]|uniref:hypothetical protein n=1 Tax=Bradyrhizobium sp. SSUT18 TaxID=3040602 RepID=UPI0024489064|nr:hypothetical protein [Bradyrhizobium sp. SSUT18]MDH2399056.1 hypothetical protein [Bradyrhizobium sp. SSUT18]
MAPQARADGRPARRRAPRFVGTPEQIADERLRWRETGIDGISLINWTILGSYKEFTEYLLPVLRQRPFAKAADLSRIFGIIRASGQAAS